MASPQRAASSVGGSPVRAPSTAENLLPVLGASGLAADVRTALAAEAELFLTTQKRVVALASAALRLANKMTQTRERLATLVRSDSARVDRVGFEEELTQVLSFFPLLARSLPRLFRAEYERTQDALSPAPGTSSLYRGW